MLSPNITSDGRWFASRADGLLASLVALGVVNYHFYLAWLVHHIVPTQTITIQTLGWILGYLALTLAIHKEFAGRIIGVAIYWCYLANALLTKAQKIILSPLCIFPSLLSSSNRIGMLALDVFPYLSTFTGNFPSGSPSLFMAV